MGRVFLAGALCLLGCADENSNGGEDGVSDESTGGDSSSSGGDSMGGTTAGDPGDPGDTSAAAEVAQLLGREPNFLIGLKHPEVPDFGGVTLDIQYIYLSGYHGANGWRDWNPDGLIVNIVADRYHKEGISPMYTLYEIAMTAHLGLDHLVDAEQMAQYWEDVEVMYQRIQEFGHPVIVHFEPDFWAFAHLQTGGDPTAQPAVLPEACNDLPADLRGVGRCLVRLGREIAPQAVLGFHASTWENPDPAVAAQFLEAVGGSEADLYVVDMLDRDAGCFEAKPPECQRNGVFYWDETNTSSPNFHEHLAWVNGLFEATGKPILWWQLPLGVPSDTPGGTPGHYRDNRVHYLFNHTAEFVEVGGVGAAFGTGANNQTTHETDGGQFMDAVTQYYTSPTPLP